MKYSIVFESEIEADLRPYVHVNRILSFVSEWEDFMRTKWKHVDDTSTTWDEVRDAYFRLKKELFENDFI